MEFFDNTRLLNYNIQRNRDILHVRILTSCLYSIIIISRFTLNLGKTVVRQISICGFRLLLSNSGVRRVK